jgi:predicted signal transduction protein with EAL and GGDEF domain
MQQLAQRNRQMLLLKHMADRFLVCINHDEVYQIIRSTCRRLFHDQAGALYLAEAGGTQFRLVTGWGRSVSEARLISYGGEEFLLMLPGATQAEAQQRAEDIRRGIANLRVQAGQQSPGAVTVSLGVASFPQHGSTAG